MPSQTVQIRTTYITFIAGVDATSVGQLMQAVEQKIREGVKRIVILISSPGGNVFYGLSAYNFLKGIPVEVHTHNFGSVDSIAAVIYCAGSKRLCVPQARFLLHGIGFNAGPNERFEEKQLTERLKSLRMDRINIAKVISANTGRPEADVERDMFEGTAMGPEEAKNYGLVHEIQSALFPEGADVIRIGP